MPDDLAFQDRLSEKSKYSKPFGPCRFQMLAAIAPFLTVFIGFSPPFLVCVSILDSILIDNNRRNSTVLAFLSITGAEREIEGWQLVRPARIKNHSLITTDWIC